MKKININESSFIAPLMKEEFRSLYSSISFTGDENRIICISSSYPNAGKSHVSYNLARIIAEENMTCLYINADMRNSTMAEMLGYNPKMIGLSHVLAKKNTLTDAIYSTDVGNLYIMPAGVFPSNPTVLLRKPLFKQILSALRGNFDYIIVDTPPIGMVTDASIIASACDGTVLVIPSSEESYKTARESIKLLETANENFLGIILNKADSRKHTVYGRHGAYGKYGYGEDKKSMKKRKGNRRG